MRNNWLAAAREARRLTQDQVAKLARIERSYYTKIENGTVPSVKVAKRIAEALGVDWTLFYDQAWEMDQQKRKRTEGEQ